ncbi:MAG: IPExxxVDY family protein [Chitinophagales bacterium]
MKLKLDLQDMTNEFFDGARLLGIVNPVKDYQFCRQLNRQLRFDFRANNQIEIELKKKQRKYFFSVFEFSEHHCALNHYLYNNQYDGEFLLPEFRHLDFLWLLKGDLVEDLLLSDLMNAIKSIGGVQLVMELRQEKIKHKEHLMF